MREGVWASGTHTTNSVWTVADTVAIGIGVGGVGSWVFSRGVVASVVFSGVEQSVTVNVLIQCIADGIAIEVLRRRVSRLRVGEARSLVSVGRSVAVIVCIFAQIALVIRWQFVWFAVAVRIAENTELDGETGVEQTRV